MSTLLWSVHIHCEQYNGGKSLLGQKCHIQEVQNNVFCVWCKPILQKPLGI